MSDLPTPFALPEYAKPVRGSNKIKLKMSGANQSASSPHAQPSFTLRVPDGTEPSKPAATVNLKVAQRSLMMGAAAVLPARSTSYANQLPVAPMTAQTYPIQPIQATPRQPQAYQYAQHHCPNASYLPQTSAPSFSQVTTSALPHIEALSYTRSPSPSDLHPLKGVSLVTKPRGRPFKLDYCDGVRSWAMEGEGSISIADVRFLAAEEESAPRNGKGKAKRGRGRPKASTRAATAKTKVTSSTKPAALPKAATPLRDIVKILLNGSVMEVKEDHEGRMGYGIGRGSKCA